MTRNPRRSCATLLTVLSLVAVLAACGESATPISQAPASPAPASAANGSPNVPPTDLQVGLVQHFTGSAAEYGLQIREGVRLATEQINASGGVNGGQLVLQEEDEGTPTDAVAVIRRLGGGDVVAVIGPQRTSSGIAVNPLVTELKLPILSMSVSKWDAGPYTFKPAMIESEAYPLVLSTLMKDCGVKTGAVISAHDDDYAVLLKDAWVAHAAATGITVIAQETYKTGDTDFRVPLTNIAAANPDVLFISGLVGETGPVMRQAREAGIKSVFQVSTADPTMGQLSSGASDGTVSASPWDPERSDSKFVELKNLWAAKGSTAALSIWSSYGYDLTYLVAQAAERAKTNTSRDAIRDALGSGQGFELALGKYRFEGSGDNLELNFSLQVISGATTVQYASDKVAGCSR